MMMSVTSSGLTSRLRSASCGEVKLVDFGVSKVLARPGTSSLTQTGMVMGTIRYLAPEVVAQGRKGLLACAECHQNPVSGATSQTTSRRSRSTRSSWAFSC